MGFPFCCGGSASPVAALSNDSEIDIVVIPMVAAQGHEDGCFERAFWSCVAFCGSVAEPIKVLPFE